jgi:hypothetical protein
MTPTLILQLLSGICWTIVYIDCVRLGFKQKTYAMPFWALALNIAWEFTHTVRGYQLEGVSPQIIINGIWCFLDIGILYTYFAYGYKYFPQVLSKSIFYTWSILVLICSFVLQHYFVEEFSLVKGGTYSAFLQNLLMSVLFIVLFVQRNGKEGQSLLIAVSKLIGTLAPTIWVGALGMKAFGYPNVFILMIGIFIAVFDLVYIGLLTKRR